MRVRGSTGVVEFQELALGQRNPDPARVVVTRYAAVAVLVYVDVSKRKALFVLPAAAMGSPHGGLVGAAERPFPRLASARLRPPRVRGHQRS